MQEFILSPSGKKYYTNEFVESLRESNLNIPAGFPSYNSIPMAGFQEEVLISDADVVIIGGRRGGGKTDIMNRSAQYNLDKLGFSMHGFRKEEKDITNGLWKNATEMYRGFGEFSDSNSTIKFCNGDSRIVYAHLQNEKEVDRRFRGIEMPHVIIDELPQIGFKTFFTLLASNRNSLGIKNKFIASCNPVSNRHWVYKLISWYINADTNEVIHERSGQIRYFFKYGEGITDISWGLTKEEVYNKAKGFIDNIHDDSLNDMSSKYDLISSFTFIEGEYSQNKIFRKKDPSYLGRLAQQGGRQSVKDIKGIWGDDDTGEELVKASELDNAFENLQKAGARFRCACADVALTGDYFVLFAFEDKHVIDYEAFTGVLSDTAVELTRKFLDKNNIREEYFAYDSNGLGLYLAGYFKRAKQFNNKERASNPQLWNNQKSECAEKFTKALKEGEYSFDDDVLNHVITKKDSKGEIIEQMTLRDRLESQRPAFKRKSVDNGKFEIIGKSQMKQECGHSPDEFEALFMREVFSSKKRGFSNSGLL